MAQNNEDDWVDDDPTWTDDPISEVVTESVKIEPIKSEVTKPVTHVVGNKQEKSLLGKIWSALSEPLTDAPSRFADTVANYIDSPNLDRSPMAAKVAGFGAGAIEGIGDLISGLTSPIDLAATVLSGGSNIAAKSGLSSIARLANTGSKVLSAPVIVHGGMQILDPNTSLADKAFGLVEMAGGAANLGSKVPTIGKSIESKSVPTEQPIRFTPPIADPNFQPSAPVKPQFNTRGQTGMTGMAQTPLINNEPIITLKPGMATPDAVKKAREQGFEFVGLSKDGRFQFKKSNNPVTKQPILESEVGNTRPTASEEARLGPIADIKKNSAVAEAFNFPRAVMASMDFSAPLRQGLPLIHKKEFWNALPGMFKSWGSEDTFRGIQESIADKPLFKPRIANGKTVPSFADDAGLKLTDLTDLNNREEALMSTWAEKIPGIRASNRAYTAFLNKLRADTFESLINDGKVFGADGTTNIGLAREIADFVNTASGRGSLGKLEKSAVALNSTFFSPRLIASRLKMLNPHYYWSASPEIRKEAIKSLLSVAAAGNTLGQLAKMSGKGTVESDPTSSDFGKIKIGNVRIDPYAGFQQYIVAASKLLSGESKSTTTGKVTELGKEFGKPTRLDVISRMGESKLNPVLNFATGILRGKDFAGQPFNVPEEVASRFIPIFLQDLKQLATENPNLLPNLSGDSSKDSYGEFHPENLGFSIPSAFGMGVQSY